MLFGKQAQLALPGEYIAVLSVPERQHAVEEVNAEIDRFKNIERRADAHKIARLVLGHFGFYGIDDLIHLLGSFPDREAADGIACTGDIPDMAHVPYPKIVIDASLTYAKEKLFRVQGVWQSIQPVKLLPAPSEPSGRTLNGPFNIIPWGRICDAFIKRHCNG